MARRTRGDGALYQRADGYWIGSIDIAPGPDGRRRRKVVSGRTQAIALEKLRAVRRDVERYGSVPTASSTLTDYLEHWLTDVCAPRVKPRTLDGYRDKVRLIDQAIGKVRLDKLTPAHVRQMHRHAADGRSSTTALHCHRVLRLALEDARREGTVLRNVADLVDAPAKAFVEPNVLTSAEAKKVLATAAGDPLAARWAFGLLYGVRQGEALGLLWESIDVDAGTIDLAWQLQRLTWRHGCGDRPCKRKRGADCPKRNLGIPAGVEVRPVEGAWVLTRPKRGKRRVVPLIPVMAAALATRAGVAAGQPNPHGLVFARPDGKPIAPAEDNRAWHRLLAAAGVHDVRLHDARGTTATLLLEGGVDAHVIASILGHSDIVTTRGYQAVNLELARRALEALAGGVT